MQIKVEHLNFIYQPQSPSASTALHDISFEIARGELVALVGHGGSGKSTLAFNLAGLYQPSAGTVSVDGHSAGKNGVFSQVGLVFQYPEQQLFGETVFEEVAFGARNFGAAESSLPQKVREALERVGLDADKLWHRSPFALSGGQKRRVCIAGTLAVDPEVYILDEPTAGLDEGGRLWMLELLRELHQQGKTVIWISHNMAEVAELAERVLVLADGRLLFDGAPAALFDDGALLAAAGLRIPPAASLVRELRQRGAELPARAVTVEQAAAEIGEWLEVRRDA
ncbi:MAG: energy-coupling factor transporter ATPase [Bacillota bacterium]|nr:energy-coupling factor transporter ATPase [Bacillota bacterium]